MCGRYAIECEEENTVFKEIMEELNRKYVGDPLLSRMKTGEIFPTETVPILAEDKGRTAPFLMNWGFPRPGASPGGTVINARAETAMEKNFFRPSLLYRRCIVPSTGFYEWKQNGTQKKKDKYLFRLPDSPMLYMAGFYNRFLDSNGKLIPHFVIITTQANKWVSPFQSRMPLILDIPQCREWLMGQSAAKMLFRSCEMQLETVLQSP